MKLGAIAAVLGLTKSDGEEIDIHSVASLDSAGPGDISFVQDQSVLSRLPLSKAGALIIPENMEADRPSIFAPDPLLAFAKVVELLDPEPAPEPGIHPTAVIGNGVSIGDNVHIGAFSTIGEGTKLDEGVVIRAGVRIGESSVIGAGSTLFENVALYDHTKIGARCRIHANSTIGSDGFGYVKTESGAYYKIPQRGSVTIEDDVEIGSNTSVDRAMMGETVIKKGVKIDNQVQIGHNTVIGENSVIAGCSGVAGSSVLGSNVMVGGMVAISDHVSVVSGVIIAGKTGVHKSITEPGVYGGPLVMKNMEYKKFMLTGKKVERLTARIKKLEQKLSKGDDK
ncbi:UDP-3-O-[3-hydroxymyristoyl] glucosamine N-acyltransferase [hydrothermal vent metagenome]|uniref:UDP-3-O-[3-hydroxymyristoyl] glucosamine N-acyltransferase n=1 Tax=hydrothermal vent metagenome TaxID=652676 RepID=A0A3B1CSG9_9ZZZZ